MREMKGSKPEFRRQESWRYKRVKENWRRPRGVTSKMRKEESGFPAKVKNGYGSAASTRGLHPRGLVDQLVWREVELEKLDPKIHIVRIAARVGEKKRRGILTKAKDLNFHIANPGREEGRAVTEALPVEEEKALSEQTVEEKMEEKAEVAEDEDIGKAEESSQ
ncbi:50S ribosomal protein L32e [Candidatus Bathyarchaeota archaeon]|nr:MAG: 50S ribosomal protein L32e [Candidatus Bathyarchaeota archaeon]